MSSKPRSTIDDQAPRSADGDDADSEYLDEFLDAAVACAQRGEELDLEHWTNARPHLASDLKRLAAMALSTVAPASGGGRSISGYTVIRELGHGAMGCVYLAQQHAVSRRTVALKVLPAAVAMSETARARFLLETRSLARVQHPHVVTIHDVIDEPAALAYAMEWIDGPTFAGLIESMRPAHGGAPVDDSTSPNRLRMALGGEAGVSGWVQFVCRVGISIARALHAMHGAGLIHRDVKPSNILLRKDGTALLSDFGLVRADDSSMHTLTGDMVGTVGYAAPELLRGKHDEVGRAADVFGLGATLFHALCFELPFGHASSAEVLRRIESGHSPAPRKLVRSLPRDLDTILVKALDADPKRRYASAAEFADDLQRLLELRPIHARRSGVIERAWKRVRRNSRSLIAGSLGIALGLGAAGVAGWQVWERAQRPARIARLVERARIRWIDYEGSSNFVFYVIANPDVRHGPSGAFEASSVFSGETMSTIIALYDDAIALDCDDLDVLTEREVVRTALVCGRREAETVPAPKPDAFSARFAQLCPVTTSAAADWQHFAETWQQRKSILDAASELDRRALGLLAFLCGVHRMCVDCLSACDVLARHDPLSQMFLGELRALDGRPELAYPLLMRAWEACPSAPRIGTTLADVALRCGDGTTAARVLEQVGALEWPEGDTTLIRVRADLAWLQGDEDAARSGYERAFQLESNPLAVLRLAQLAESHGDHEDAWRRYLHLALFFPSWPEIRRGIVREVEAWWRGLDASERQRHVRAEVEAASPAALPAFVSAATPLIAYESSISKYSDVSDGAALHAALVAVRRFPPIAEEQQRSNVPWITSRLDAGSAAASHDGPQELRRMVALATLIDCSPRRWLDLPRMVRAIAFGVASAWDHAIARSEMRDDPAALALSRAFGESMQSLITPLARR